MSDFHHVSEDDQVLELELAGYFGFLGWLALTTFLNWGWGVFFVGAGGLFVGMQVIRFQMDLPVSLMWMLGGCLVAAMGMIQYFTGSEGMTVWALTVLGLTAAIVAFQRATQ